jgi:hypothetical protein
MSGKIELLWTFSRFLTCKLVKCSLLSLRDVALAQIVAMENPDVAGRHCFCNEAVHLSTVLQVIHEAFHDMELPTRKVRVCGGLL